MKFRQSSHRLAIAALTYALVVALGIEAINAAWNFPLCAPGVTEGSGAGKMRGAMGEFQNVLLVLGVPAYAACVFAAQHFVRLAWQSRSRARKIRLLLAVALCAAIFVRLCWLGVASAGLGLS